MKRIAAALLIFLTACAGPPRTPPRGITEVTPAPEWEALFTRTSGWTGADGAATVPLPGGRILWLFGDTWIGPVVDGRHAEGSAMVNNTIAISPASTSPGAIRFLWNNRDAKPAAWAVPLQAGEWFWPASGGVIAPGPEGRDRLLLFMARLARIDGSDSVWNFRARGSSLLAVANPSDKPEAWQVSQSTLTTLGEAKGARVLMWGSGALVIPGPSAASQRVMILGIDETNVFDKKLVMARAPARTAERFETWEFRTATGWSERESDAAPVVDRISSEVSLHRMRVHGRDALVLVYSEANLGPGIMARVCAFPDGRWSEAVRLFVCPEPAADPKLMVYSAKAHPELSHRGELLISYCVNSTDFWDVAAHADKYRPRFIRVPDVALPSVPRR